MMPPKDSSVSAVRNWAGTETRPFLSIFFVNVERNNPICPSLLLPLVILVFWASCPKMFSQTELGTLPGRNWDNMGNFGNMPESNGKVKYFFGFFYFLLFFMKSLYKWICHKIHHQTLRKPARIQEFCGFYSPALTSRRWLLRRSMW